MEETNSRTTVETVDATVIRTDGNSETMIEAGVAARTGEIEAATEDIATMTADRKCTTGKNRLDTRIYSIAMNKSCIFMFAHDLSASSFEAFPRIGEQPRGLG